MNIREKEVVKAPNGERITMKDVYAALYDKEKADADRHRLVMLSINTVHDRITTHEDNHNLHESQEDQVKVDFKKGGVAGILTACSMGLVLGLGAVVKFMFGIG